jgi:hypothetical protein
MGEIKTKTMNKKKYIIDAIKATNKIIDARDAAYALGIDLSNYDGGIDELVTLVAVCVARKKSQVQKIERDVYWWLYDSSPKKITLDDKSVVDVEKLDSFVNWLFDWYGEKTK